MRTFLISSLFFSVSLCACSGGSSTGTDAGATPTGAPSDKYIKAELELCDGSTLHYEAAADFADGRCTGLIGNYSVASNHRYLGIMWKLGTTPTAGAHSTGDAEQVDIQSIGPSTGGNIGPPDAMTGRDGAVSFTEVGAVTSGTFSGTIPCGVDSAVKTITNGTFRCVQ